MHFVVYENSNVSTGTICDTPISDPTPNVFESLMNEQWIQKIIENL